MKLPLYQIDAFAEVPFQGNPAAVCPLESWLPDDVMQKIAEENNLAETSFYVKSGDSYELRWFTPTKEVDLCGHATIAAAYVLFDTLERLSDVVRFNSKSGWLSVQKDDDLLTLDFPQQKGVPCDIPEALAKGLGKKPREVYKAMDYMAIFDTEDEVLSINPKLEFLQELDLRGVIITAMGNEFDFVSRFFAPNYGIPEDPVTGSAHCTLAPYWAGVLGKNLMSAKQLSRRTGILKCKIEGDRVLVSGKAIPYLKGHIEV